MSRPSHESPNWLLLYQFRGGISLGSAYAKQLPGNGPTVSSNPALKNPMKLSFTQSVPLALVAAGVSGLLSSCVVTQPAVTEAPTTTRTVTTYQTGYMTPTLPTGYRSEQIDGTEYYTYNGNYYRPGTVVVAVVGVILGPIDLFAAIAGRQGRRHVTGLIGGHRAGGGRCFGDRWLGDDAARQEAADSRRNEREWDGLGE